MKTTEPTPAASPAPKPKAGTNRVRVFFNGFTFGVICCGLVAYYLHKQTVQHPEAQQRFEQATDKAADAVAETIYQTGVAMRSKLEIFDLKPEQITEELARTGKIVRRRASDLSDRVSDATSDAYVTTAVTTKIAADHELSIRKISVSTSGGHVTLNGTVATTAQVGRALALALDTEGVRDVTANLVLEETK